MFKQVNQIETIYELMAMAVKLQRSHEECMNAHLRDILHRVEDLKDAIEDANSKDKEGY